MGESPELGGGFFLEFLAEYSIFVLAEK